ncbi:MAG: hypothetical protein K940chlam9_00931 [Chlamydiae bacterium]|nr:hypothetical protein [Chlamydiota bacterium]
MTIISATQQPSIAESAFSRLRIVENTLSFLDFHSIVNCRSLNHHFYAAIDQSHLLQVYYLLGYMRIFLSQLNSSEEMVKGYIQLSRAFQPRKNLFLAKKALQSKSDTLDHKREFDLWTAIIKEEAKTDLRMAWETVHEKLSLSDPSEWLYLLLKNHLKSFSPDALCIHLFLRMHSQKHFTASCEQIYFWSLRNPNYEKTCLETQAKIFLPVERVFLLKLKDLKSQYNKKTLNSVVKHFLRSPPQDLKVSSQAWYDILLLKLEYEKKASLGKITERIQDPLIRARALFSFFSAFPTAKNTNRLSAALVFLEPHVKVKFWIQLAKFPKVVCSYDSLSGQKYRFLAHARRDAHSVKQRYDRAYYFLEIYMVSQEKRDLDKCLSEARKIRERGQRLQILIEVLQSTGDKSLLPDIRKISRDLPFSLDAFDALLMKFHYHESTLFRT